MRKRVVSPAPRHAGTLREDWINLEAIAKVEVSSELASHPIEGALLKGEESGWRAEHPGEQTIRLFFDRPQRLSRIRLLFLEPEIERTQEFTLRWSPDGGRSFQEIVRQQWNFSPPGTIKETEDYRVELTGVTVLELSITPDKSGGEARASLGKMRLA